MSSNKLTYYHRLSKGDINYGPLTMTVTSTQQVDTSVESFEFCHNSNTSTTEFSTAKETSVSGVLKAFSVSNSHSQTFAETSEKSTREGQEIKVYQDEFVSEKVEITRTIEENQFLAHYVVVDLYCFTVNGGERQYSHVPRADVMVEPMDAEKMASLSEANFLMEKASWEVVTARYPDIELDDIPTYARQLTPLDVTEEEVALEDPLLAMGKVYIFSNNSLTCLDGRDKSGRSVFITADKNANVNKFLHWNFEKVGEYYAIKSVSSNCYMDGRSSKQADKNGAVEVINENPATYGQFLLWKVERYNGNYAFKSLSSNCYLDGRDVGYSGDKLRLTSRNPEGDSCLQWTIFSVKE